MAVVISFLAKLGGRGVSDYILVNLILLSIVGPITSIVIYVIKFKPNYITVIVCILYMSATPVFAFQIVYSINVITTATKYYNSDIWIMTRAYTKL